MNFIADYDEASASSSDDEKSVDSLNGNWQFFENNNNFLINLTLNKRDQHGLMITIQMMKKRRQGGKPR